MSINPSQIIPQIANYDWLIAVVITIIIGAIIVLIVQILKRRE